MKHYKKIIPLLFILAGCFQPEPEKPPKPPLNKTIRIITGGNINYKRAISVDFVQVFSKNLLNVLLKMNSKVFQANKQQMLFDFPSDMKLFVLEVVSNQNTKCYKFPSNRPYWGIVAFINFKKNVKSRFMIPSDINNVCLQIKDGIFKITQEAGNDNCVDFEEVKNE